MSRRYIDCPIPWCDGEAGQHGDEGTGPESWLHLGPTVNIGLDGRLGVFCWQEGAGPVMWSLMVGNEAMDAGTLGELVAKLRGAADELERHEQDERQR